MFWQIALYSAIGCVGMAIQDYAGTVLVRSVATGRGLIAGCMDAISDLTKITILSVSGVELTHQFGWRGWFGILPIMLTGFLVTWHATHLAQGIENEEESEDDDARDSRLAVLEAEIAILRGQFSD